MKLEKLYTKILEQYYKILPGDSKPLISSLSNNHSFKCYSSRRNGIVIYPNDDEKKYYMSTARLGQIHLINNGITPNTIYEAFQVLYKLNKQIISGV